MSQLYHINGWDPRRGIGNCGFTVQLWPAWKQAVAHRKLTQENVNTLLANHGRAWLDHHGYDSIFDPDNCGWDADETKPPGPNAGPMYDVRTSLLVRWGEWGPEHITVPGDACGLDLADGVGAPYDGREQGRVLLPHNVDSIYQASLLLTIFLWFAGDLVLHER